MKGIVRVHLVLALGLALWLSVAPAFAGIIAEGPTQLSVNPGTDGPVELSGDLVVWRGDDGNDWEIYAWKPGDASPTNVSNADGVPDQEPQVSGNRVVWRRGSDADGEIYTWKVGDPAPTNVSNTALGYESLPQVSGDLIVWQGWDGNDLEIYARTVGDAGPTNISNNDWNADTEPQVSGSRIVWTGWDGNDWETYTWKVGDAVATDISNNDLNEDQDPQLYGDRVVWAGWDGGDYEIYTWKPGDAKATNTSNNSGVDDYQPQVWADRVAWYGSTGADNDIYTWKVGDAAPLNISNRAGDDRDPQVHGDRVVWEGDDGSDSEIYTWRMGVPGIVNISDRGEPDMDPQIFGNRVVWYDAFDVLTVALDSTPPSLGLPMSVTLHASSITASTQHAFAATATDAGGVRSLKYYIGTSEISSPHAFPLGTTTVRCEATDEAGNTSTATFDVTVLLDTTLTVTPSSLNPDYGKPVTLTAVLKSVSAEPLPGEMLVLERMGTGGWTQVGTSLTGAVGVAMFRTGELRTATTYRVRFAGTTRRTACTAPQSVIAPRVRLTRTSSWKTRSRNKTCWVTGRISPRHSLKDANKVRVRLYKKGKDGRYRLVKSYKASFVYRSKTATGYRAKIRFTSKGRWAVRAYHPADKTHAATWGSTDYVTVR